MPATGSAFRARRGGAIVLLAAWAVAGVLVAEVQPVRGDQGPQVLALTPDGRWSPRAWVFALAQLGKDVWAVGNFGLSVQRPSGAAWVNVVPPKVGHVPLAVSFAPNGAGVAVGQDGAVWDLAAGSTQWVEGDVGSDDRLFSVALNAQGDAIAGGSFGALYTRAAGARDWQRIPTQWEKFDGPHFYAVLFADDRTAVAVGEHGWVVQVSQGTISTQQQYGEESLFALIRCGEGYVAAGQEGAVVSSPDGVAWTRSRIATGFDVYGLGCLPGQRVVALGPGTVRVGSPAAGWEVWEPATTRPGWFSSLLVDGSTVLIGGQGNIWRTQFSSRTE